MPDNIFNVDNDTIKILGISIPAILVAGYLAGKLLDRLLKRHDDEYRDFKLSRDKFIGHFTGYIQSLSAEDCALNYLIRTIRGTLVPTVLCLMATTTYSNAR